MGINRMNLTVKLALMLVCATFLTTGCVAPRTPVVPYYGFGFNQTSAPVDITFGPNKIGQQVGRSSSVAILGLFSFGDCSVATATRNGNLKQVDHIDCKMTNIFGIYVEYETIVSGIGG